MHRKLTNRLNQILYERSLNDRPRTGILKLIERDDKKDKQDYDDYFKDHIKESNKMIHRRGLFRHLIIDAKEVEQDEVEQKVQKPQS